MRELKRDSEEVEKERLVACKDLFAWRSLYESPLSYWGRWLIGRVEDLQEDIGALKGDYPEKDEDVT